MYKHLEAKAKEIVLLCEKIPAAKALEMGLLHRVFPDGSLSSELDKLLDHHSGLNQETYKLAKSALTDPGRTTNVADIRFDVLAMKIANTKSE